MNGEKIGVRIENVVGDENMEAVRFVFTEGVILKPGDSIVFYEDDNIDEKGRVYKEGNKEVALAIVTIFRADGT